MSASALLLADKKAPRKSQHIAALKKLQAPFDNGTLTETQFNKFSAHDKAAYLKKESIRMRGDRGLTYGHYDCLDCAIACVFQTGGYISE